MSLWAPNQQISLVLTVLANKSGKNILSVKVFMLFKDFEIEVTFAIATDDNFRY